MSIQKHKRNSAICSKGLLKRITVLVCPLAVAILLLMMFIPPKYTERTAITDYGHYDGTGADRFTSQYIQSFFPTEIEDYFCDVQYSYKAENTDTYGFEAFLEFTIEDEIKFQEYIANITSDENWQDCTYASGYKEYCIENVFDLDIDETDDPTSIFYRQIVYAKIRKILYSADEQRLIYVALGVYDGGGIGTNYFNTFFDRFAIDPIEYEQSASSGYGVDPFGIS